MIDPTNERAPVGDPMTTNGSTLPAGIAVRAVPRVAPDVAHAYWTLARVARALGAGPAGDAPLHGVSTDTRTLVKGDLFVALRGEHFDAHEKLADARAAGAAALVVSDASAAVGLGLPTYIVADTLVALGDLAAAWRSAWGRSVIAVAGSNGKTSTKDMLRAALAGSLSVHATKGNLNNLVGVPLSLLAIPSDADVAVIELGTNAPGEISRLRAMSRPDVAVLVSIGEEHLEGLGSIEGVLAEECAVFDDATLAVLPAAYPDAEREAVKRARSVIRVGLSEGDLSPSAWGMDDEARPWMIVDGVRFELPVRGAHQAANALLAIATARACGVSLTAAAAGLAAMPAPAMRGVWASLGTATVINDAYNANPPSAKAALALLETLGPARQRVAVLGTMLELGVHEQAQHATVADVALSSSIELLVGVGAFADALAPYSSQHPERILLAPTFDAVWPLLEPRLARDAVVLLKGSRGMRLERLVPLLTSWAGA